MYVCKKHCCECQIIIHEIKHKTKYKTKQGALLASKPCAKCFISHNMTHMSKAMSNYVHILKHFHKYIYYKCFNISTLAGSLGLTCKSLIQQSAFGCFLINFNCHFGQVKSNCRIALGEIYCTLPLGKPLICS